MKRSRCTPTPERGDAPARARRNRAADRRRAIGCAVLAAALASGAPAAGQEPRLEEECCLLLLVPVGARSSAMGGAITAGTGVDAVFRNPAGLAGLQESTFVVHHSDRSLVDINAFTLLMTPGASALGLTYQLFDKGTSQATDENQNPIGELSYRDHLVIGSLGMSLGRGMAVGVNYRFHQERIDCRGLCSGDERVTTTHAADVGYRFAPRWHTPLQLGVALVNMPIRVDDATALGRFPARIHVGVAYDVLAPFRTDDLLALRLALDVQDELRDLGSPVPSAGLELDMQQTIFLRAGYTAGEGLAAGAAIGVALRYDRFDIGLSRSFVDSAFEDDEPFQVTFGLHF